MRRSGGTEGRAMKSRIFRVERSPLSGACRIKGGHRQAESGRGMPFYANGDGHCAILQDRHIDLPRPASTVADRRYSSREPGTIFQLVEKLKGFVTRRCHETCCAAGGAIAACLQTEFGDQFLDAELVVGGDGFQDAAQQRAGLERAMVWNGDVVRAANR